MRRTLATLAAVAAGGIMLATPVFAYPGQGHDDPCQEAGSNCGHRPTVTVTTTAATTVYSTLPGTTVYVPTTAQQTVYETTTVAGVPVTVTAATTVTGTETLTETAGATVTEVVESTVTERETAEVTREVTRDVTHEATETAYATATLTEQAPAVTLTERETLRETVTGTATVTQHQLVAKSFGYVVEDGSSRLVTSGESTGPVIDGPATTDAALAHTGFDAVIWSAAGALALIGGGLLLAGSRRGEHR